MDIPANPASHHSLAPREVLMNDDERLKLAVDSEKIIEAILESNPHLETVKTIGAIELEAGVFNAPSHEFATLMPRVYDRAFVEATFECGDDALSEEFVREAKIILFCEGKPAIMRSELIVKANDDGNTSEYDPTKQLFTLRTLGVGKQDSDDQALSSSACKALLDGLVMQANEFQAIVNPDRTFAESLRALLEVANEKKVERTGTYRVLPDTGNSFVDFTLSQRFVHIDQPAQRIRDYHRALIESHQSLDKQDSACTSLEVRVGRKTINAIFGVDYEYYEDGNNDGEVYEHLLENVVMEFNEPSRFYPSKFTEQVIKSLRLLEKAPANYFVQARDGELL